MTSLSVDVSLSDVALAIEYSGNSESERREIMDFLLDVDRGMADVDWSVDLITELSVSTAQDMESEGFMDSSILVNMPLPVPGLPDGTVTVPMAVKVADLVRAMAEQTPHLVIQIMAEALHTQVRNTAKAKAERAAEVCGNCAHTRGHHYEADSDFYEACQDTHCMCQEFTEFCGLVACGHSMKNHNTPFPCANDTHRTNCHPCAVNAKEA